MQLFLEIFYLKMTYLLLVLSKCTSLRIPHWQMFGRALSPLCRITVWKFFFLHFSPVKNNLSTFFTPITSQIESPVLRQCVREIEFGL